MQGQNPPPKPSMAVGKLYKKPRRRMRFLTGLLLLSLVAALATDGVCAYTLFGKPIAASGMASAQTPEEAALQKELNAIRRAQRQSQQDGTIHYTPSPNSSRKEKYIIADEDDALDTLCEMQNALGLYHAQEEYRFASVQSNAYTDTYTMQQYYNGVEVYGYELRMTVNASGEVRSVSGTHAQLDGVETATGMGEYDAREYAEKYIKSNYQLSPDACTFKSLGKKIFFLEQGDPCVGYAFAVSEQDAVLPFTTLFVDVSTGDIKADYDQIEYEMLHQQSLQGQQQTQQLDFWKDSDKKYLLKDTDRNMTTYRATAKNMKDDTKDMKLIEWNPKSQKPDASGVDALANLQTIYDYYQRAFQRDGITNDPNASLTIVVNIQKMSSQSLVDNAAMYGTDFMAVGQRSDSKKPTYASEQNVMAHEYTHGVVNSLSNLTNGNYSSRDRRQKSVQLAISEGLADSFAEFAEDWADDQKFNNSCDWENVVRNAKAPTGSSLTDAKNFVDGTTDCHHGATIVSHAAYLMATGVNGTEALTTEQIGNLYFYMTSGLTSTSNFETFRMLVEQQALEMNADAQEQTNKRTATPLTDGQLECVIDALDQVGIKNCYDYSLLPNATLKVYDNLNQPYQNYHLVLYRNSDGKDVVEEDVTGDSYTLPDLPAGVYVAYLTDLNNSGLTKQVSILINDNAAGQKVDAYQAEGKIPTNFGAPAQEVTLVLDHSGSMNGTPIQETRDASLAFVDTVLDANPNTRISLITYQTSSSILLKASNDREALKEAIREIESGGGTNMYEGMETAASILEDQTNAVQKIMVMMSDGAPCDGPDDDGDFNSPIIRQANQLKDDSIIIYSLGFFHENGDADIGSCRSLMNAIATTGYHYEISSLSDVQPIFDDIARQVGGETYQYIRISDADADTDTEQTSDAQQQEEDGMQVESTYANCMASSAGTITPLSNLTLESDPVESSSKSSKSRRAKDLVDVVVRYNGEVLSSADGDKHLRTSFGTLGFDGENNEIKVLRLRDDIAYEICLQGRASGNLNYEIGFADADGAYSDLRSFQDIPVTKDTLIATNTDASGKTVLKVDRNGDGTFELQYRAGQDETAKNVTHQWLWVAAIGCSVLVLLLLVAEIFRIRKRYLYNSHCPQCGRAVPRKAKFCQGCRCAMHRIPLLVPEKNQHKKQKKAVVVLKWIVVGVCLLNVTGTVFFYRWAPTTIYRQIQQNELVSAELLYEETASDSQLSQDCLSLLLSPYLTKLQRACTAGSIPQQEAAAVYQTISNLELGKVSDRAKEAYQQLDGVEPIADTEQEESSASEAAESE